MEACQWVDWIGKCYFTICFSWKDRRVVVCVVLVGEKVSGKGRFIVSSEKEARCLCGQTSMDRCTLGNLTTSFLIKFPTFPHFTIA